MYKISCYVPESDLEKVKQAMFAAGAGKLGEYNNVAWQTLGTGQFKPLAGSKPTRGEINEMCYVSEYKIEMLCEPSFLEPVITALKLAHSYETPAYDIIEVRM